MSGFSKKKALVTMGIPGSGKSYAVARLFRPEDKAYVINPDSIREELTGDAADQSRNGDVFDIAHLRLRTAIMDPDVNWVVFDATNVTKRARQNLLAIFQEFDVTAALLVFDIDFSVCAARNMDRDRTVPMHAMMRMQEDFEESLDEMVKEPWVRIDQIVYSDKEGVTLTPVNPS
jgi:predicted kinase